ncbi:hypothetical protein [Candidatus Methanodesulfokora washburnensis]|nr:hypothetical protein [Candidatus Methanodesulfokores washburnensis]
MGAGSSLKLDQVLNDMRKLYSFASGWTISPYNALLSASALSRDLRNAAFSVVVDGIRIKEALKDELLKPFLAGADFSSMLNLYRRMISSKMEELMKTIERKIELFVTVGFLLSMLISANIMMRKVDPVLLVLLFLVPIVILLRTGRIDLALPKDHESVDLLASCLERGNGRTRALVESGLGEKELICGNLTLKDYLKRSDSAWSKVLLSAGNRTRAVMILRDISDIGRVSWEISRRFEQFRGQKLLEMSIISAAVAASIPVVSAVMGRGSTAILAGILSLLFMLIPARMLGLWAHVLLSYTTSFTIMYMISYNLI